MANTHGTVSDFLVRFEWRTGRDNERVLYAKTGSESHKDDPMVGAMDTPALAHEVVTSHNDRLADMIARETQL